MNWITDTANTQGLSLPSLYSPDWMALSDAPLIGLHPSDILSRLGPGVHLPRATEDGAETYYPLRETLRRLESTCAPETLLARTGRHTRRAPSPPRQRSRTRPEAPGSLRGAGAPNPQAVLREQHHRRMTARYGQPGTVCPDVYSGPAMTTQTLRRRGWTEEMIAELRTPCSEARMLDMERRVVPLTDLPLRAERREELRRSLGRTLSLMSAGEWLLCDLSGMFYLTSEGMLLNLPYQAPRLVPQGEIIPTLLWWATPARLTDIEPDLSAGVYDRKAAGVMRTRSAWSVALAALETAWPVLAPLAEVFRQTHALASCASVSVRLTGRSPLLDQARAIAGEPWPYGDLSCEIWCSPLRIPAPAQTSRPAPTDRPATRGAHPPRQAGTLPSAHR